MSRAKEIMSGLTKWLGAGAFYNPALRVIAYVGDEDNKNGNYALRRVYELICRESGGDNEWLIELNDQTRSINRLPRLRGDLMEIFKGYNRI